ncbi:hypothetical protein [Actinokineospora enzanensis]|uniref:hypothetical protein n=1 Tax=Actinokineospora enzanensis TaxID=155975 RepID=UPI00039D0490|nr:hypothetical protein [Actinokineospora enzanensis]
MDALLAEVDATVRPVYRSTSPVAMRDVDVRRERRAMRRAIGAQVRVLPVAGPVVVRGEAA